MAITKQHYETSGEWLSLRKSQHGFGGSEIPGLLNVDGYTFASPVSVVAERAGLVEEETPDEKTQLRFDFGHYNEEFVARLFCERTGKEVHRENCIWTNDEFPHMFATIDRKVVGESAGLECKTTTALAMKKFKGGDYPANYYAQSCSYLAVTGMQTWYIAVLVGNDTFLIYAITRDPLMEQPEWAEGICHVPEEELAALRDVTDEMWGYVERKELPPVADGKPCTMRVLSLMGLEAAGKRTPEQKAKVADISGKADMLAVYKEKKALRDQIDGDIKTIEADIKATMLALDAEAAKAGKIKITFKPQTRRTLDKDAVADQFEDGKIPDECFAESTSMVLRIA